MAQKHQKDIVMIILYKFERAILKTIRRIFFGKANPGRTGLISGQELNNLISNAIRSESPFMIARYGSIELEAGLYYYILNQPLLKQYKLFIRNKIHFLHEDSNYAEKLLKPLCNNAGFFPEDIELLPRFSSLMAQDTHELCCCCCAWENEDLFNDAFSKDIVFARLEDLEPYDYAIPWSKELRNRKVLVIHPFQKSIEAQYAKRSLLWQNKDVLPDFDLKTIKAVQSIAGEEVPFNDWFEALDYMKSQMDAIEYDVAIIGCGAYGFHLAAHAKRTGHKAIHLGGATQILFGIKGKRWDNLPAISKFYNEHWVYPLSEETPKHNNKVENGCYW